MAVDRVSGKPKLLAKSTAVASRLEHDMTRLRARMAVSTEQTMAAVPQLTVG